MSGRDRRALLFGAPAILLVVAVFFVGPPVMDAVGRRGAEHARLEQQCRSLLADKALVDREKAAIERLEKEIGAFEEPLAYDEHVTRLFQHVYAAAKRAGVKLKSRRRVEARSSRIDPRYDLAGVRMQLEAPFVGVVKFLHELQQTPGVFSIESLELSADPKKPQALSVQIQISTFVQPDKQKGKQKA